MEESRASDADEGTRPARGRRSARVVDVAAHVGISVATVSRAFSKPDMVREEMREVIFRAARELGYSPNPAARALRLMRSHVIGVLVPTLDYAIFARMINTIENAMAAAGYLVLIATTGFDRRAVPGRARQLLERGAEAILCVGRVDDAELRDLLDDRNVPLVITYTYEPNALFPSIGFDNAEAARSVSEHLRQLGHRRIAVLLGPLSGNERQELRRDGFRAGFEVDVDHRIAAVLECVYSLEAGAKALDRVRAEWPEVTAIACSSDVLAAGVMSRCEALGIGVPETLSVVGFDDLEFVGMLRTSLTTVRVPAVEMGRRAASALLTRLETGKALASVRVDTSLVRRASTASPTRAGADAVPQPAKRRRTRSGGPGGGA